MIYFLAKSFSPQIALSCTLALTMMAYHISLSQEGRNYTFILFLGMLGLFFFLRHLRTSKRKYLILTGACYALLFYTSYRSIPFIALSQILWFYAPKDEVKKPTYSSFLVLSGVILLFCLPWILFIFLNYKGQPIFNPFHTEGTGSFLNLIYRIFNDWSPYPPLMIVSALLLILFPFFLDSKKNAILLLTVLFLPIVGLYLFCKVVNITHFIASKYLVNFLPFFFIAIFMSLRSIEDRLEKMGKYLRLNVLFLSLLIASNLVLLPLYYRSEKQDFRGW
jgi:hypothetical protein